MLVIFYYETVYNTIGSQFHLYALILLSSSSEPDLPLVYQIASGVDARRPNQLANGEVFSNGTKSTPDIKATLSQCVLLYYVAATRRELAAIR